MRHGEHEGNVDETKFYEKPDHKMSLTEKGFEDSIQSAKEIKEIIEDTKSIKWFVSPYYRCKQTFNVMSEQFGGKNVQDMTEEPRLREQEWGNIQDPSWKEKMAFRHEFGKFFYRFPNGESGADVYDRQSAFLETLFREFKKSNCKDNFILISHGFTLRMLLARYFRWTIEEFEKTWNIAPSQYVIMKKFLNKETNRSYYKILNHVFLTESIDGVNFKRVKNSFLNWPDDYENNGDI